MTTDELARLVDQYGAGIRAELQLLRELAGVADEQHHGSRRGDFVSFGDAADRRDVIMRSLVKLEDELREIRSTLSAYPDETRSIDGFEDVAALHREAVTLVNAIMAGDQQSLSALADAELARRSAVASLERGETTLAAYRRVLTPPVANARLVRRQG